MGDYRFYYVRKFFPDYEYYWLIEYDIFCNAPTYEVFLSRFIEDKADLLILGFRNEIRNGNWVWTHGLDWIYKDKELYGSLFPVVRLTGTAIDFLYQRRLSHREIYQYDGDRNKWVNCELFVPTELMHGGFSCATIDEPYIRLEPRYLNDDRFFLTPDNRLYHPVKSVSNEISKLNDEINGLNLLVRKLFIIALINMLSRIIAVDINKFPLQIDKNYYRLTIPVATKGGGYGRLLYLAIYQS